MIVEIAQRFFVTPADSHTESKTSGKQYTGKLGKQYTDESGRQYIGD